MRKIDRLLVLSFIGPLCMTFFISLFVLLMTFLWQSISELVGKGLDWWVIMELMLYASATFVPMALPLAILLASIMTLGNLGERYELVAMKAAGISLWRVLRPQIVLAVGLACFAFYFSNNIMPVANLEFKTLYYEVKTKKPAVNIRPNEFYSELDGYVIRIGGKEKDGKTIHDVLIYDHASESGVTNVIKAKSGLMYGTEDGRTLVFELFDGFNFSENISTERASERPLTRVYFASQIKRFDLSSFAFMRTAKDRYSDDYRMMNLPQLMEKIDSLNVFLGGELIRMQEQIEDYNPYYQSVRKQMNTEVVDKAAVGNFYQAYEQLSPQERTMLYKQVLQSTRSKRNQAEQFAAEVRYEKEFLWRHEIEKHRKFTLSVACVILFFVGAPLGAIIRKGGLGLPVVVSGLAFVLFYVIGMVGERAAREGAISCEMGMWIASLCFLPIGLFLTFKATTDSSLLSLDHWQKVISKIKGKRRRKETENAQEK